MYCIFSPYARVWLSVCRFAGLGSVQDKGKCLYKGHGLVITFAQPLRQEQSRRHRSCEASWPQELLEMLEETDQWSTANLNELIVNWNIVAPCADICDDAGDTKVKQIERQRYCTYDVSYRAHMNSTCSKSLHGSANENVIHICRCVSATPSDQIIFQCVFHPWACRQFCTIILNNGFCFSVCSIDASNHVFILVQFRLLSTSPGKALTLPFKMQSVATSHRGHAL